VGGRTRFAFVTFRPVLLNFDIKALSLFLYFRSRLLTVQPRGTESIQLVVQSGEKIHKIVLHIALNLRCHTRLDACCSYWGLIAVGLIETLTHHNRKTEVECHLVHVKIVLR